MSVLHIKQITSDGRSKVWKVDKKNSTFTFGLSRKSDFGSLDRLSSSFDAVIEKRDDGWHFISFDLKSKNPDLLIENDTIIEFNESKLTFKIEHKTDFVLDQLSQIKTEGQIKKRIIIVSKNNKILKTEVKAINSSFYYLINSTRHEIRFNQTSNQTTHPTSHQTNSDDLNQWLIQEIEGFTFKSKILSLEEMTQYEKIPSHEIIDKDSQYLLFATLIALFLFVSIGIFTPKNNKNTQVANLPISGPNVVFKLEPQKPKTKVESSKSNQKFQASARTSGGKATALVKGAIGARISQLLGKVSATEARTQEVIVTNKGLSASEESGRALAAIGKVDSSGRNWSGEANSKGSSAGGISTKGVGGGKGSVGLGQSLTAGKTGSGGVGLLEEESEVEGGLDREVIAQYIKSQLGQILYCYERQLSANPELYGKISVKFTISGNGQVISQAINQTTLKSVPVEGCILNKVAKWKFPEPKGGTKVVVTYPFLFKSTN